jgi:hypothetical protein
MDQNISFGIDGIELLEYSIISPDKVIESNTSFRFDMNIEHRFNIESKRIFVVVSIDIFIQNTDIKLCNSKISCIYNVPELDKFLVKDKIIFPNEFITTLNSISLSTCRGILFSLYRGTFLHTAILPVVDPKGFIVMPGN